MPVSIPKKSHSASVFVDATLPLITMNISFHFLSICKCHMEWYMNGHHIPM